jgi:uncharacterized protein YdiU (UPF0061 family)
MTRSLTSETAAVQVKKDLGEYFDLWQKRLSEKYGDFQSGNFREAQKLMRQHNPVVIPRNHHVEKVIKDCVQNGKTGLAEKFLNVLRSPYEMLAHTPDFQDPPADGDKDYKTFCGT